MTIPAAQTSALRRFGAVLFVLAASAAATFTAQAQPLDAEPAAAEADQLSPAALIRDVCFARLGDLEASERALIAAGFERAALDDDVAVYERAGVSALLGRATLRPGREATQCTLLFDGLDAAGADLLALTALQSEGFEIKALMRQDDVVIRDFGSPGAGFSAAALGSTITLSDALAGRMMQRAAGGVSVLAHSRF